MGCLSVLHQGGIRKVARSSTVTDSAANRAVGNIMMCGSLPACRTTLAGSPRRQPLQ